MKALAASALAMLACLCIGPAFDNPALAAWQAQAPPSGETRNQAQGPAASPFALPDGSSQAQPKAAGPAEETSPFALPSGQAAQPPDARPPAADAKPSPFALPGSAQGQAAARPAQEKLDQGLALAKAGRFQEAEKAFAEAVRLEPANGKAWNNLGLARRKLGMLDDALGAYQSAMQAEPALAMTYKNLGVLWEQKGDRTLAARNYERYVELAPDAPDAKQVAERAGWLMKSGKRGR